MKRLVLAVTVGVLAAPLAGAQQEKNVPTEIRHTTAGDVDINYLNFKWDAQAFEAMEKGGGAPAARRSWALARILTPKPLEFEGKPVTGGALLILNPASGSTPMTLEIRVVDMRDVFKDSNVIAVPPPGQTVYEAPANFEKVDSVADRLALDLKEKEGTFTLSIHYGDYLATLQAVRK
jgi:hypothetical protein